VDTVANGGSKLEASTLLRVVDAAGAVRFTQTATTRVLAPAAGVT
jgi:hypothetical protein